MTHRPVIGIATQTLKEVPGELPRCWIMSQRYIHTLASLGAVPWLIPLLAEDLNSIRAIYERLDGVFLTGGVDVDPGFYGETRHEKCGPTDIDRDTVEMQLVRWVLEDHKPLLAVCRGFQVLNVACGGTLYQDVAAQVPRSIKHDHFPKACGTPRRDYLAHEIDLLPKSRLERYLGQERALVNSMHHQGIKKLAGNLVASAWAPDGLIEGIEGPNGHYLVGVQWHPEELTADSGQRRLFTEFLAACESR